LFDVRYLPIACGCLLLAVFSKMHGLVLLPLFLVCGFVALRRADALSLRHKLLVLLPCGLMLSAAALYMSSEAYLQRAVWTVAHMAYAQDGQTEIDTNKLEPLKVLARYASGERWYERFFLLFPVAAVLAVPAVVHALRDFWRERRLQWDQLTLLWLLLVHGSLQLSPLTDLRFYLSLFPPVALLGARGLDLTINAMSRWRFAGPAAAVVAIGICGAIDLPRQQAWFTKRTYGVRDANQRVMQLIGPRDDATVVGMWAPWLTMETPYKFYIVRNYFNVEKQALGQLGITHLLLAPGDRTGKFVRRSFPRQFRSKRALDSFKVYTQRLTLYELTEPLGPSRP
jgi:hypothetical protein